MIDDSDPMVNVLANCLDAMEQGDISPSECLRCYPQHQQELWIMLQVVDILQNPPRVPMRARFRREARQRLLAKIAPPPPAPLTMRLRAWWREQTQLHWQASQVSSMARLAIGILLVVMASLLSMGGLVLAANGSLPGGTLYPLKLAVEDTRLFVLSDPGDAKLHLDLAERRLNEIEALAMQERFEETRTPIQRYESHIAGATRAVNRIAGYDAELAGELAMALDQVLSHTRQRLGALIAAAPLDFRPLFQTAADISNEYRLVIASIYPWDLNQGRPSEEPLTGEPTHDAGTELPEPPTGTATLPPTVVNTTIPAAVTEMPATLVPGMPSATQAPVPAATATPTPTATPTATPVPTSTPTPTPIPIPLPQPTNTATPLPATWTPVPTSTPLPTNTPLPTSTPIPTGTPAKPTKYPPGLTKTPQPPGLTMPPGLTKTPQPPGLTRTPES